MNKGNYKGYYNIVKSASSKEATIHIYGIIGGWDFEEWKPINTADKFVKDFQVVEKEADTIHVKINSPGGNVWDGLPIYNTLKNSKKTIYTYVDGIAYSMASLIALAGDTVYGYNNSMLMFHNGSTYSFGNAKAMREEAATLDQYDEALGSIIEEKLKITSKEVKEKYLNYSDNYFVGKKAKELGFFDEIITSEEVDVPEDITKMSPMDVFKHYATLNFSSLKQQTKNRETMSKLNVPLIEAVLGASFSEGENENGIILTDEQAMAIENRLSENDKTISKTNENIKKQNTKISNFKATRETLTTAIQKALKTAEVEGTEAMSNEEGITALSNLIAEYGSQDGVEGTKPLRGTDDNYDDKPNVVGGMDISAAMNN
ncbi:head maturation protease, ClpP-related [Leptobacterium sp. I13]|uniref:head maturation protease, ClpP-related n=1 Tax=Leptobacterium meishanense TaxID=3128904 RepID=UPI0030ED030B